MLFWVVHRVFTPLKLPPKFRGLSLAKLFLGPATYGFSLAIPPVMLIVILLWALFKKANIYEVCSSRGCCWYFDLKTTLVSLCIMQAVGGDLQKVGSVDELSTANSSLYRAGRMDLAFLTAGLYLIWQATVLLLPPKRKRRAPTLGAEGEGDGGGAKSDAELKLNGTSRYIAEGVAGDANGSRTVQVPCTQSDGFAPTSWQ